MSRDTTQKYYKGQKMSPEVVRRRNETRRRLNPTWHKPETVEKLRAAQTGMRYDRQARLNMSVAQTARRAREGKNNVNLETRMKISFARRKRPPMSAEQKEMRSYRMKLYWEKRKKAEAEGKVQ